MNSQVLKLFILENQILDYKKFSEAIENWNIAVDQINASIELYPPLGNTEMFSENLNLIKAALDERYGVLSRASVEKLAELCMQHDVLVFDYQLLGYSLEALLDYQPSGITLALTLLKENPALSEKQFIVLSRAQKNTRDSHPSFLDLASELKRLNGRPPLWAHKAFVEDGGVMGSQGYFKDQLRDCFVETVKRKIGIGNLKELEQLSAELGKKAPDYYGLDTELKRLFSDTLHQINELKSNADADLEEAIFREFRQYLLGTTVEQDRLDNFATIKCQTQEFLNRVAGSLVQVEGQEPGG
jgi:hypothetical protein